MPLYEDAEVGKYLSAHCHVEARQHVHVHVPVTPELWHAFVWMTPLNQDLAPAQKEALAAHPAETVTLDLHLAAGTMPTE